jgi:ethanolamine permease
MLTLIILCILTFSSAVGVAGWESIVYLNDGTTSDSPLPLALGLVIGTKHPMYHLLITIGLFGLIASFNGIILISGRAIFEFGRQNYAPKWLGEIHPKTKTPIKALCANAFIGILALLTGKTSEIIILSCFGAILLYIISMLAHLKLRITVPGMHRPFKAPFYPFTNIYCLIIAVIALLSMTYYFTKIALVYYLIIILSFLIFKKFRFFSQLREVKRRTV